MVLAITGDKGTVEVSGDLHIRRLLGGLKSTLFEVKREGRRSCSTARASATASACASSGRSAWRRPAGPSSQILEHYYRGTHLHRLTESSWLGLQVSAHSVRVCAWLAGPHPCRPSNGEPRSSRRRSRCCACTGRRHDLADRARGRARRGHAVPRVPRQGIADRGGRAARVRSGADRARTRRDRSLAADARHVDRRGRDPAATSRAALASRHRARIAIPPKPPERRSPERWMAGRSRALLEPFRDELRCEPIQAARLLRAIDVRGQPPAADRRASADRREIVTVLLDGLRRQRRRGGPEC